jgi:hypothetical protein
MSNKFVEDFRSMDPEIEATHDDLSTLRKDSSPLNSTHPKISSTSVACSPRQIQIHNDKTAFSTDLFLLESTLGHI